MMSATSPKINPMYHKSKTYHKPHRNCRLLQFSTHPSIVPTRLIKCHTYTHTHTWPPRQESRSEGQGTVRRKDIQILANVPVGIVAVSA